MRSVSLYFLASLLLLGISCTQQKEVGFWFDSPAEIWEETLPLGNGRIGMMPWGGLDQERITLNEISMWTGSPQDSDNPVAGKYLPQIRDLLFKGKNKEAQDLMYKTFTCKGPGSGGPQYGHYAVFADLYLDFGYPEASVQDYRRELDMSKALSINTFSCAGINFTREYLTSMTEDVGLASYSADTPGSISFTLSIKRDSPNCTFTEDGSLILTGNLYSGTPDKKGLGYAAIVKVVADGGEVHHTDSTISVTGADIARIYIAMNTDFAIDDPLEKCRSQINSALSKEYEDLKSLHSNEFSALFGRVSLDLPCNENSSLPMDRRLEAFQSDSTDLDLISTYMQYGRYLLIGSTRVGNTYSTGKQPSLPPNLQGLWAHQMHTPWNGDYHLNINLQMNLWGAEIGNLSELHLPMLEYTRSLVPHGEKTASTYYGSKGWVTHILGNVWGWTSPSEDPSWGATNTAGAWLCRHIWEHYLYTQDIDFLKEYYPVMHSAAEFFSDMLVEDPRTGYLLTSPTTSPENQYYDSKGQVLSICAGSTMDNQLVRELFSSVIDAHAILADADNLAPKHPSSDDLISRISAQLGRLAPTSIGRYGQIVEWNEDYEEVDIHHRHVSQLYGLHPACELTWEKTPELMEAARTTLERRGDWSTGWSMAWKINFWARLKDGDRAFKLIRSLLKPAGAGQGSYPNMFSAHPPMQIDGNFGGSAGIMEMLLQSHDGGFDDGGIYRPVIEVLPALPKAWDCGSFKGLVARGGVEVDCQWKDGRARKIVLKSPVAQTVTVKYAGESICVECPGGTPLTLNY